MMATTLPGVAVLGLFYWTAAVRAGTPSVCTNAQLSCSASASASCCFLSPGGQLLQTQFWDTDPSDGPSNSWTIHGLWPDNCDGTFSSNCDSSRDYTGISSILKNAGMTSLLNDMNTYWKNQPTFGTDEELWEHEWATHGTCINTFDTKCYTNYKLHDELLDFLQVTVDLFKTNPTYDSLSAANILPSTSKTYTSAEIQAALTKAHGKAVTLGCDGTNFNQVYYHYHVLGSAQTGTFEAAAPVGSSTCPSSGIKYVPKSGSTTTPTSTSSGGSPGPTGTFSGKGTLNVVHSGSTTGCLISAGAWFTSGTCATYTATASGSGFTLTSSKGNCGIVSGQFECGSGVSLTTFGSSNGLLSVSGSTAFFAASVASGQTQVAVFTTSSSAHSTAITISWSSS